METYDVSAFSRRLASMRQRVSQLFRRGQDAPPNDLLLSAFDELQHALEELQGVEGALRDQHQQRLISTETLETERRHFCDLFERAPAGYLVTTTDGTIRQVNSIGAALLGSRAKLLVGRSLALFIPEGGRRAFRARVPQLRHDGGVSEWRQQIQPWDGEPFEALLLVMVAPDSTGRPSSLRWIVHQIVEVTPSLPAEGQDREEQARDLEERIATLRGQLAALYGQIQTLASTADAAVTEPPRELEVGGS